MTSWKGTFEADRLSGIKDFLKRLAHDHFLKIEIGQTKGFWFEKGTFIVHGLDKDIRNFKMDLYESIKLYNA